MAKDFVEETVNSGVKPIEVEYYPIKSIQDNQINGFRSVVKINSVSLGTLYPEQYRIVSNRNAQCIRLAKYALNQFENDIPNFIESGIMPPFITVYIPTKMLMRDELANHLKVMERRGFDFFNKICLEFSSDLLLENTPDVEKKLKELSFEYGFKFAISEYADEFCPVLRIKGIPLNYVFLDKTVLNKETISSDEFKMVVHFIQSKDASVILDGTDDQDLIDSAYLSDCNYYVDLKPTQISEVVK